jgi:hypothetical protein
VYHLKIALSRTPVEIRAWCRSTFADKAEGRERSMICPVIACGKREAFAQGTERFARMHARDERNCARAVTQACRRKSPYLLPGGWIASRFEPRRISRFARNDGRKVGDLSFLPAQLHRYNAGGITSGKQKWTWV